MNYQEIETFLTVLDLKTISAAAQKLYISQGTASHRIQSLENELGVTLFDRQPGQKRLLLTHDGNEFFPLAKRWKALYQETMQIKDIQDFTNLSIGAIDAINNFTLIDFYKDILQNDPSFKLKISTYHSNEIYSLINKYSIDLGLTYLYANYPDVNVDTLFEDKMILVTKKNNNLPNRVSVSDLKLDHEIYVNWGVDFEVWHNHHFDSWGPKLLTVGTGSMQLATLDYPDSWAFLPESLHNQLKKNNLRILQIDQTIPARICYILTHQKMLPRKSEASQEFIKQLRKYLNQG